ncbi:MAG: hypothetical protein BMS9Abin09_0605 [Gammaproteobacteria bacterium]|nr:MAG: hypothetical protein BMS9Abin09_0605 [Gammaproteobacteria bacterium]
MKPVYRIYAKRAFLMLQLIAGGAVATEAPVTTGAAPETGLRYWEWKSEGALFRLTQRLPDQTRAYFMARGFDAGDANHIAERCVFQSMFKNIADAGDTSISIDLDSWLIRRGNDESRLLTREKWKEELQKNTVSRAAAIALEWSLLPTRQDYSPGDYNWGMTSYGLEPGQIFDLEFSWERNNQVFHGTLKRVECARDIHPEPDP